MRATALVAALITGSFAASLLAAPQDQGQKTNIDLKLQSQYMPTKLAGDRLRFTQLGSVLVIQLDGLGASPANELTFGNSYKDGRIKHSLAGALLHQANNVRDLQAGEKVYLLKTEVKDSGIVFNVQSCIACDGSPTDLDPMPYRASLTFQFPKRYWDTTDFAQIQQTISQVFTFADSPDTNAQPITQQPAASDARPAQQQQPAPQPEPVKIELGQTPNQVIASLGRPDKVVDLGSKKIYIYKDLKVTFVDGKVSDVQ
jgi:hypothetical protein